MTGDDQRDRIFCAIAVPTSRATSGPAPMSSAKAPGRLRRPAPMNSPCGLIDLLEQRVLVAKVEPDAGKIGLFA